MAAGESVRDGDHRRRPGRPRGRLPPEAAGPVVRDPRRERARRRQLAQALGLAAALLAGEPRRAARDAVPGAARRRTRRRTRWPTTSRPTPRDFELPVRSGDGGRRADEGGRPLRRTRRRPALRGRQRRRRDGRLPEAARPELRAASSTRASRSSTRTTTATCRSCRTGRCSSSARATRAPTSPSRRRPTHDAILSGTDTGQIPAPIESRRGRIGFRGALLRRHARPDRGHADRPEDAPARPARRRPAPPLQAEGPARGGRRARARAHGRRRGRAARARRRTRPRRRGTSSGAPASGPTSRGSRFPFEIGDDGYPVQYRGVVASSPGLYFVGLPFLHSFASMLIGGAGRDAERVVEHLVSRPESRAAPPRRPRRWRREWAPTRGARAAAAPRVERTGGAYRAERLRVARARPPVVARPAAARGAVAAR